MSTLLAALQASALRQQHALGLAGRARGVADQQRRVVADLRARGGRPAAAQKSSQAIQPGAGGADGDQGASMSASAIAGWRRSGRGNRFDDQHRGGQSCSICWCSGAARRQLSGMNSAPSRAQANSRASISGLLKPRKATQLAAPHAGRRQRRGERSTRPPVP
jgi:hypothetical protein